MNPQSSGKGGREPRDEWGTPRGATQQPGPQAPGPDYVYEVPEDFQDSRSDGSAWGASGGSFRGSGSQAQNGGSASGAPGAGPWSPTSSGSPIPGMSAKDFQKMCRSVDKAFSQFARIVDQGVSEAAEALGQSPEKNLKAHKELQEKRKQQKQARKAEEEARRRAAQQAYVRQGYQTPQTSSGGYGPQGFQQVAASATQQARQWAPLSPTKKRFRSSAGLTASGVVMTAVGGVGTVYLGVPALVAAAAPAVVGAPGVAVTAALGILTAGFAVLLGFGIRNLRRASKLKALARAVGEREAVSLDEVAARMQVSPKAALSTSRALIKGGYLPQGRIDDENTTLMVTENAYQQYRTFQQNQRQTLAEQQAAEAARAAEAAARAAREQDLSERLTPEQRAFVARGRDYVRQMDELNAAIDDAVVSERIAAIQEVVGRILARAEEEPAVIACLGRLNAYYLPTTVKLLDAYDRLEEEPIQGENISSSRNEIERTLEVLHSAFEKLFDDTYQDLSLDVSADISVLHAMLAQEGLTEGPFDVKP